VSCWESARGSSWSRLGTTLRYPYEVREAKEYFDDIPDVKVALDMLKLADHILKSKATDFDPSQFVDHYEQALVEMLKKKQAGLAIPRGRAAPPQQNVVNLMDTLRRSLAQEKAASAPRKKGRKRIKGQRELLLPIAGKNNKGSATRVAEDQASIRRLNRHRQQ
jgi:DNA end-binding protein Ku